MSDLIKSSGKLLSLIEDSFTSEGLPKPYVKEIFLMECHIAGTTHVDLDGIEPELLEDDPLIFKREADNEYDKLAILIFDKKERKLGYVPMIKNEVIARLMDAGKLIFGKMVHKKWHGDWLKVTIKVFMRDF
ncbi:MAG: HIRAN domain-containing protein [Bacteroidota bacterium]